MLAHPPTAVGAIATTCAGDRGDANGKATAIAIRRAVIREESVSVRIRSGSVPVLLAADWPLYMAAGRICETGETGESAFVTALFLVH